MQADNTEFLLRRASDALERGEPVETLRWLARIEPEPADPQELIELASLRAWALSELGRHDEALEVLEPVIERFGDSTRLHATLGVVLCNRGNLEQACEALETARMLDPDDEVVLANLALVCEKLRDFDRALELYDAALAQGGAVDWILPRRASVLCELGQLDAARRTLLRYMALHPDDAQQWVVLGVLFGQECQFDKAYRCFERAEQLAPELPGLRMNWALTAIRAGDLPAARRQLDRLAERDPESARVCLLRAMLFEESGQTQAAEDHYHRALKRCDHEDELTRGQVLELAMDFYSRHERVEPCRMLLRRAYLANACTVELCEAYREATGRYVPRATWYSLLIEADYRPGLLEVHPYDPELPHNGEPARRFMRNIQVVATDHDHAVELVMEFARQMGEKNVRFCAFLNEEPIEDTYTGIYEVEREAVVLHCSRAKSS